MTGNAGVGFNTVRRPSPCTKPKHSGWGGGKRETLRGCPTSISAVECTSTTNSKWVTVQLTQEKKGCLSRTHSRFRRTKRRQQKLVRGTKEFSLLLRGRCYTPPHGVPSQTFVVGKKRKNEKQRQAQSIDGKKKTKLGNKGEETRCFFWTRVYGGVVAGKIKRVGPVVNHTGRK